MIYKSIHDAVDDLIERHQAGERHEEWPISFRFGTRGIGDIKLASGVVSSAAAEPELGRALLLQSIITFVAGESPGMMTPEQAKAIRERAKERWGKR